MNILQYEAILNQYEWIEEDYRHEEQKKKQAIARETVFANVEKYIRTHKREHRQAAIAVLELCSKLGCISTEEITFFTRLLTKATSSNYDSNWLLLFITIHLYL